MAGVSPAAITKACRNGLGAACNGTRVDLDHPASLAYLTAKGRPSGVAKSETSSAPDSDQAPTAAEKRAAARAAAPTDSAEHDPERALSSDGDPSEPAGKTGDRKEVKVKSHEVTTDVGAIADMTIREVLAKFGTVTAFKDWLYALKSIEAVREKNLRNAEAEGKLITRALVETYVFGMINATNKRLLKDAPKMIAGRLFSLARAGRSPEEGETLIRDALSSHLKHVKANVIRSLDSNGDGELKPE